MPAQKEMQKLGDVSPEPSALAISKIAPVRVWDHRDGGGTWLLPSLSHTEIIPTLWQILYLIQSDWGQAAACFAVPHEAVDDSEMAFSQMNALESLKPRYIHCLFSYINFFFTLENGFQVLLTELGQLNNELQLRLDVPKRPKQPAYVEKLRRVRNNTVVHWGGPAKKNELDSRAGRFWGFSWPGGSSDLTDLAFGNESLQGANDRVLHPIPKTHSICVEYLKQYDEKCADLLGRIVTRLPITLGTRQYEHVRRRG